MSVKVSLSAQATPYLFIKIFATSLLASRAAPCALGPTVGMPADQRASAIPSARGSSGPITARSAFSSRAIFTKASLNERAFVSSLSEGLTFRHFLSNAVPPFPGTQITSFTAVLFASVYAMACSRPPEPATITFVLPLYRKVRVKSTLTP